MPVIFVLMWPPIAQHKMLGGMVMCLMMAWTRLSFPGKQIETENGFLVVADYIDRAAV